MFKKAVAAMAAVAAVVGLWSSAASAHVTINTLGPVTKGSFAKLGFSVPNERDDAGTVKVSVQLPRTTPWRSCRCNRSRDGTSTTTTRKARHRWRVRAARSPRSSTRSRGRPPATPRSRPDSSSCSGSRPARCRPTSTRSLPGDPDLLERRGGRLDRDGGGGAEPEHPAPTVQLVAADSATRPRRPRRTPDPTTDSSSDTLAIVALIVGGVGLLAAIAALVLARRTPRPA